MLTYTECYKALEKFENNKSPGNDGLTAEFYKAFWPILGTLLVDSLNAAYLNGKLSNSQRQAIIRLIEKKDKDRRYLDNWRPISLLNVDYKIGSKALAVRLEKTLPFIIHENQCTYVKGRTIFDAVRSINDVMEYTKLQNIPGLMTTFDFKKAFDSLSWNYLFHTLKVFNFGDSFLHWIRVLYSDISSCIMNNGFASDIFEVNRGVRQGDPLSPYLSIIALEIVNISIRENNDIKGIKVGKCEVKLSVFADDLTTFVSDTQSFFLLQGLLDRFGRISGLRLNEEKTEAYWLGSLHESPEYIGVDKVNKPMKILGIFFTYNWQKYQELNFENIIRSIQKSINAWRWRNLTLIGRIQIIKTFAIPKIMFRASLIPLTKEIVKQVNNVLFNFIWNSGKDKIKRLTRLISDYKDGGLRMPHIETLIKAQRIMCMKKYLEGYNSTWKLFLDNYLADFGGAFLTKCNYDVRFLPRTLPKFYKECLTEWALYKISPVTTLPDVLNEIIWNNKFLCIDGKPLFRNKLLRKGFLTVSDILTDSGRMKSCRTLQNQNVTGAEFFVLMSVFKSIPSEWKTLLRDMPSTLPEAHESQNSIFPSCSRYLYWQLIKKIEKPPISISKYELLFPLHDLSWKDIYVLPRRASLDSKIREFQYKVLNRILYVNKALYKIGIASSPLCTFCQISEESLGHLFIHCPISSAFWLSVVEWLKNYFSTIQCLTDVSIMFGLFGKETQLINHIILLGKQVIFQCRLLKVNPSLSLLKTKIKITCRVERVIAEQNDIVDSHNEKWKAILHHIQDL